MTILVRTLEIAAGLLVVAACLYDIFQSVILPRATHFSWRISSQLVRRTWPHWRAYAVARITDGDRREDILGAYAPLAMVVFLVVWVLGLIVGYGSILYGLRDQLKPAPNFLDTLYFAGTSLLTIGYGDIVPVGTPARFIALLAGASGFGVVAVVTAFLFAVFGAFQAREVFVVTLGTSAGAPPSGVTLLETYARWGILADLGDVFEDGQRWAAAVLETHLAYPIIAYFRSSHDSESWIGALGALLDASTLAMTLVENGPTGHAKLVNLMCRHATHDLARYFRLDAEQSVGVERYEFDVARSRLADAGLAVREADPAWEEFAAIRRTYAASLNAMARHWSIPPAQWVGDRSLLSVRHKVTASADHAS